MDGGARQAQAVQGAGRREALPPHRDRQLVSRRRAIDPESDALDGKSANVPQTARRCLTADAVTPGHGSGQCKRMTVPRTTGTSRFCMPERCLTKRR